MASLPGDSFQNAKDLPIGKFVEVPYQINGDGESSTAMHYFKMVLRKPGLYNFTQINDPHVDSYLRIYYVPGEEGVNVMPDGSYEIHPQELAAADDNAGGGGGFVSLYLEATNFPNGFPVTLYVANSSYGWNGNLSGNTEGLVYSSAPENRILRAEVTFSSITLSPDATTTPANTPVEFNPTLNDNPSSTSPTDLNSLAISLDGAEWVKTIETSAGLLEVLDAGMMRFTPSQDWVGEFAYSYQLADEAGNTDSTTNTITVTALPSIPGGRYIVDGNAVDGDDTVGISFSGIYGPVSLSKPLEVKAYPVDAPEAFVRLRASLTSPEGVSFTFSEDGVHSEDSTIEMITPGVLPVGPIRVEFSSESFAGFKDVIINDSAPVLIQGLMAVPYAAPVLHDMVFEVPYETASSFDLLSGQNPGEGSFDLPSLKIQINGEWVDGLDLTGVFITVGNGAVLNVNPEPGFEGAVEDFYFGVSNEYGVSSEAKISMVILEEPPVPLLPIEPLEDLKWVLGSFRTGELEGFEIPVISDSISLDVFGDEEADISIPLYALSDSDRSSFRTKFEINEKMIALIDSKEQVIFAGYVEKLAPSLKEETLDVKVKGFKAWLKTRFVMNSSSNAIEKASDSWVLKASPRTVAKNIVSAVLSGPGNPEGIQYPASKAGIYEAKFILSELTPVSDALDDISTAVDGAEIKFRPKMVDNRIIFELIAGSPHLGDAGIADVVINLNDENMVAVGFDQIDDGSAVFNKIWLESDFEGKEGETINLAARVHNQGKLIRESKEKISAKLTGTQLEEQYAARVEDANKAERTNSLTIWDDDFSFWAALGRRVQLVGEGRSAGMDDIVRVVGLKFSTKERTMTLEVSNIKRIYPPLPSSSDDIKEAIDSRLDWDRGIGSGSLSGGGGGSSENPWNPGEGGAGEWTNSDLWGGEGQPTDGSAPVKINDGVFGSYSELLLTSDNQFVAGTIAQNSGNRLFALGRNAYSARTDLTDYDGNRLTRDDGLPINGFEPIPILKSFVQNGASGEWSIAGHISPSIFQRVSVDTSGVIKERGYILSMFILANRLWVNIVDSVSLNTGEVRNRASFIYTEIDGVGNVGFNWTHLDSNPSNLFIPPAFTTRFGDKLIFTAAISFPQISPNGYVVGSRDQGTGTGILQKQNMIFIPSAIEKWVPLPPLTVGIGDTFFVPTNYGGNLYVAPARQILDEPYVMKLRLSPSGFIAPTATWERAGKIADFSYNNTMGTIRGYVVYNKYGTTSEDQHTPYFVYRKIHNDGTLADEQTSTLPLLRAGIWSSYYYGSSRDVPSYWAGMLPQDTGSNDNAGMAKSSVLVSYGGYMYRFYHESNGGTTNSYPPVYMKSIRLVEKTNQII